MFHHHPLSTTSALCRRLTISRTQATSATHAARPRIEVWLLDQAPLRLLLLLLVEDKAANFVTFLLGEGPGPEALMTLRFLGDGELLVRETVTLMPLSPHELTD